MGSAITVLGLAGLREDIAAWQKLVSKMTRDDRVLALAERAVEFAAWVNQPWVRVVLVVAGVLSLLWRLPGVWRLRHRLWFDWRKLLVERVWIDREAAIALMRHSEWGQIKRPATSLLDFTMPGTTGLSASEKQRKKFRLYLELSLDAFGQDNPASVREVEGGGSEYDEASLRKFVRSAMMSEIEDEFGAIPRGMT
ncbi:hypothetical protein GRI62_14260 [Erythrobacter arachoides]|uniref:Uncharacterized protein n=1 Tax=Aurantiacibacter arachoides TaxID=1850444 RepID=A0A845A2K4_9SPHN|nr:hypothetical protein [Aurantiacibacter arachoides]MXO94761.1 hypothetical protein [Aurantiacibacter arachoides]